MQINADGIEAYSFSTPFGYIISQAHNLARKLFDSLVNSLPDCLLVSPL